MAELIFKDSGLLIDEGYDSHIYEERIEYDPDIHAIVETGQVFNQSSTICNQMRSPRREIWFYFPTLNCFFLNERSEHSIIKAFKSMLEPERFDDILDGLERTGPIHDLMHSLEIEKLRKKLERARQDGLITVQERVLMEDLVVHLNGSETG